MHSGDARSSATITPAVSLQQFSSALTIVIVELALAAIVCGVLYLFALLALRAAPIPTRYAEWRGVATLRLRKLLIALGVTLVAVVLAANAYLVLGGLDPREQTLRLVRSIPPARWIAIGIGLAKLALAVGGFLIARRVLRRLLRRAEQAANRWHHLKDSDRSTAGLFRGFNLAIVNVGWLLLAVYASVVLHLPRSVTDLLLLVTRVYLVVAIGLIVIRSTAVIVMTLDGLSHQYAQRRNWQRYYDHLRSLLPTFRACLEYALWVGVASLVMIQLAWLKAVAAWGPRLIQSIVIFFAGRVLIELGHLEIEHRMLPPEGLEDTERRRRATMVPLVRSGFAYAVYFGTAALMLGALGFNPMPFLAGAGILGLVVGFGAQSLINDVVSGFFILVENIYLVGDMVEVGAARGVVESIDFRTTKIRDGDGRVHTIRNGDMKPVVNYSKGYSMAVVTMEVAYDADLAAVFAGLRHAGTRLRAESREVLDEMRIDGITAFGASTMTVRTSTRVVPGRHESVAAALRLLIKETTHRQAADTSVQARESAARGQLNVERV